MSTIWTPSGEYAPKPPPSAEEPSAGAEAGRQPTREEVEAALAQARADILATPVLDHLAGHAMGLFELAAIHLQEEKPDLTEARLAIDALAALVEGLGEQLGKYQASLTQALAQLRLAFVQASSG